MSDSTALDVTTLRESFELVAERSPLLTRRFYALLFERHPQVRPLFGASTEKQEEMLTRALVAVLDRIEDGAWLTETLEALGAKHVDYGVTDEMYSWVGDALLAALAEAAGEAWTPRVNLAWTAAYVAIADRMMAGARKAQSAPSPQLRSGQAQPLAAFASPSPPPPPSASSLP